MWTQEFSNEFDVQIGAYLQSRPSGIAYSNLEFDEYEKSVFLTKGEESLAISYYTGKNPSGDSFEKTEEVRRYLSDLVKTKIYNEDDKVSYKGGISEDSIFFALPKELWFITYESVNFSEEAVSCGALREEVTVTPVTQDEYHRIKKNPFRGANERRVLRLDPGLKVDDEDYTYDEDKTPTMVELVSKYDISSYKVRYLSRPKPIILVDLPEELSINGYRTVTECELNSALHREILDRAVLLAIASKSQSAPKEEQ